MACLGDKESALDASLYPAFQPRRSLMDCDDCTISTPFNQDIECLKVDKLDTAVNTYNLETKPLDGKVTSSKPISLPSDPAEEFFSSVTSVLTGSHDSGHNHACVNDDLQGDGAGVNLHKQETMEATSLSRKEKRKNLKKIKRKQIRKQVAEKQRFEEVVRLADPVELLKIRMQQEAEATALEIERQERETQERLWLEREQKARADAERKLEEKSTKERDLIESEEEYGADYVEGPPEIIWQGNEIIVKKRRVKVPKELSSIHKDLDDDQPISNPLPPQSAAFAAHRDLTVSKTSSLLYESFEQNPNFGTEQDKTHCPFHIKTGVCRFGIRCSRVHVYPEKSSTLLMKNMYTGPGLAWEHDEGLEHTDEEVAQHYEEFYEDVHSEFLKFGELVNFKVCRNISAHLRGNVYVHYRSEDAAMTAFNAMNGRYFASKQILCEFVGVTRWKVAICGEYMKAHHRPCSHGTACNFLHCFRNPGGEYDWADWDSPPPLYWQEKMEKLFGYREANYNHEDKERKGGQYEYSKRHYDGYDQQLARDRASDNRHRRWHTCNRHDDRSRFRSSSDKHHYERRNSKDLNRQHHKRNHSETDSEKMQGSYSEDGYDAQNHGLRSPETRKESKRRYHDNEREWSVGMDSDISYKPRKRQVSTDMRKQKFEDSDTNWSDPESKKQMRFSSKQEKRHVSKFDYESGASETSNSEEGLGQRKHSQRPKDRGRKSSETLHDYMKRHNNGYNQQPVRDNASDNKYKRYNTHNRHDDHGRLQSGSSKHCRGSQSSKHSNSQHDRRRHSETDSEKLNTSNSEDSYDVWKHRLRSSETRKEPKRRYRDNERDESTGFHSRDSNSQRYSRNQSETDSEKSKGLYSEDDCDTLNHRPRLSETRKNWKRRYHDDEPDRSTGIDSDDSYDKKRKRHVSIDRKKQKFEDSDSDWSQPDSDKQRRGASSNSGGGLRHRKHHQRPKDRRRKSPEKDSEKSDYGSDVTIPKSKLLANRKCREKNSNDVLERPEYSELMDVLESNDRHRLSHIKKSERKRLEMGKNLKHEDESEQRPHKHRRSNSRKTHGSEGLDSVNVEDRWQGANVDPNGKSSTDCQ